MSCEVRKNNDLSDTHQMGRLNGNTTSLMFDAQKDIEKRQEEKSILDRLKHFAETFFIKAKDLFHANKAFYQIEKPINGNQEKAEIVTHDSHVRTKETALPKETTEPQPLEKNIIKLEGSEKASALQEQRIEKNIEKSAITLPPKAQGTAPSPGQDLRQGRPHEKPVSMNGAAVFEALTQECAQKLYTYLSEERYTLTPDLTQRVERQAEKAATFIFHAHTLKGTQPTEKETEQFLLRAKHELNRMPEIRDELIHQWNKANSYKGEKDELIAHLIAERQASIEGRIYLEAKQRGLNPTGLTPPSKIPDLATKELKINRALTETIAQELIENHGLSKSAATFCAKDILRYQEIHGEKPSSEQMAAMLQISREFDKRDYPISMGAHNIEYLRRREGDLQFREMAAHGKDLSGFREFPYRVQEYAHTQGHVKPYNQEKPTPAKEEHSKAHEMDFSM